ncbi:hypothetical protein [Nocardiopsis sp. NRRL B-16309]|uniref:hypothetical protein n=1 Tax=Nocardiopsis sp. NRRL B-16309 TaxID=1519494 RepID=UPI0006AF024A|nr:hypothetical protein [Nocardiopsis sp. NRRL B-16309]KOX13695.1 hypothetical protein ADL05_18625 [Nocardiopsis sp. NRRL B-16309]
MPQRPAVGELYDPRRSRYPETASWRLSPQREAELLLCFNAPDQHLITAVEGRTGPPRFALVEQPDVLILAVRFEGTGWMEGVWQASRQETEYPPGLPAAGGPLPVVIDLVDALSGVITARSAVTWPPPFATAVRRAIDTQIAGAQDDTAAQRELNALYSRYPTTAKLVRERATATCSGGTPT